MKGEGGSWDLSRLYRILFLEKRGKGAKRHLTVLGLASLRSCIYTYKINMVVVVVVVK